MKEKKENSRMRTAVLLLAGAGLLFAGALLGQAKDVLMKAVQVCLECIGVG